METIDKALLNLLCAYLDINTSQPAPDYAAVFALFGQQAQQDGFEITYIPLPSGNTVMVITLQGTDANKPALALNHHMDVVPATRTDWAYEPFAGTIKNNMVYGRGVQDMKGVGVVHYGALQLFKQRCGTPSRTIHLLLVPDEEIGGFTGVGQLVHTPAFKNLNIGYILDEGLASGDPNTLLIKVAERKPLQIKITSPGTTAHGSHLLAPNPIHHLIACLTQLNALHHTHQQQVGPTKAAGNLLSLQVTGLHASGNTINMIPAQASATLDIRVPPSMPMQDAHALIKSIIAQHQGLTYQVVAEVQDAPQNNAAQKKFYALVKQAITQCRLQAKPLYFEASSDLRFYLAQGIQGLGLTPFTCKENLHGTNEAVSVNDIALGCRVVYGVLTLLC